MGKIKVDKELYGLEARKRLRNKYDKIEFVSRVAIDKPEIGACGKLEKERYTFAFHKGNNVKTKNTGRHVALSLIELYNLPQCPSMFTIGKASPVSSDSRNRSKDTSTDPSEKFYSSVTDLNLDIYNAIHLLLYLWGNKPAKGLFLSMLTYVNRTPHIDSKDEYAEKLVRIMKEKKVLSLNDLLIKVEKVYGRPMREFTFSKLETYF